MIRQITGVIYHHRGTSCIIRLLTSLLSLRKHYSGPVTIMQEGPPPPWVVSILNDLRAEVQQLPEPSEKVLVRKTSLWRDMRYTHAMFLDADTIVQSPIDEFIAWTVEWGFVASWFSGWLTTGTRIRRRLEEWHPLVPELIQPAINYGKAINGGVQGWSKEATILPEYERLTRLGDSARFNHIVVDEIALQLLLPHHCHYVADHVWNTSGAFGNIKEAKIIHYHGRKHCLPDNLRCDVWKKHYCELRSSFPEWKAQLSQHWGDRRLGNFISKLSRPRNDITIVTAVDPAYAGRLKRNIKRWLTLPGLENQRFLVFVNGFKGRRERRFLDHPNVRVVRWNYNGGSPNRREYMLAAFIFGVAKHVKTPYWMKLDADCAPRFQWWEWPQYRDYAIVSQRWGFTRMKGDAGAQRHWFNRLDDVFRPQNPYFKKLFDAASSWVSHRPGNRDGLPLRFNSFCHIERTDFTRRIAAELKSKCDGRMAIPSQDTTSWYCAQIWAEKVKLTNFKKWFKN